jgi:vancomycin resistance protein YoaR
VFSQQLAILVEKTGSYPQADLDKSGKVVVANGTLGQAVDIDQTAKKVLLLSFAEDAVVNAPIKQYGQVLTEEEVQIFTQNATRLIGKSIELQHDITTVRISDDQLIRSLQFPNTFNQGKITEFVQNWQVQVNREPQNAIFEMNEAQDRIINFSPHRTGRALNLEQTSQQILSLASSFFADQSEAQSLTDTLIVEETQPEIPLEKINPFGIKERIGFGESFYNHSIPSRIHNVSQASKIVNNSLVMAGEEFSFNTAIGEVSRRTGFKPAYVIKGGATVLGDGGGVCQVSTTLFRALLDAGLEITRRLPHSYRVSYYEINNQPGFDATVYAGNVDLRFRNDTNHPVLLHFSTFPEQQYMTVEIFGVSDGRSTEITEYKKWDARRAPASVYIDDPTLPTGKTVQIDWAVGGIKAKFTHIVKNVDGTVRSEKEYYSNYIPWSAKFRRGTGV